MPDFAPRNRVPEVGRVALRAPRFDGRILFPKGGAYGVTRPTWTFLETENVPVEQ